MLADSFSKFTSVIFQGIGIKVVVPKTKMCILLYSIEKLEIYCFCYFSTLKLAINRGPIQESYLVIRIL